MKATTERYARRSRRFLSQAADELAVDDLEQASEKGWGAAAQIMKAAAEERGWRHGQHRQLFEVTRQLEQATGDPDIRPLFHIASDLHANFYEGHLHAVDVQFALDQVDALVQRVERLIQSNGA